MLMATRTNIDFHRVEPHQVEIHDRLTNWAKWCNSSGSPAVSPMFRMYRSAARARGAEHTWLGAPVDGMDAGRLARFVGQLPTEHRKALNWFYVKPVSPRKAATELGTTLDGLALLVRDGRQMLINRRA